MTVGGHGGVLSDTKLFLPSGQYRKVSNLSGLRSALLGLLYGGGGGGAHCFLPNRVLQQRQTVNPYHRGAQEKRWAGESKAGTSVGLDKK